MEKYDFKGPHTFEFEIKDLTEITHKKPEQTGVPHRANFYQIIWIDSHHTVQEVDFRKIKLLENQLLFVSKNQVVRFDTQSNYTGKIMLFTDVFFKRSEADATLLKETHLFDPFNMNTVLEATPKMRVLLNLLEIEATSNPFKFQEKMLYHLFNAFIIEASQNVHPNTSFVNNEDHTIALVFFDWVEQHFKTKNKVNDYLEVMPVSAKRLVKAIKKTTGKTPKQFLDDRMLLEAKRLLVYSDKSIKEIGFELGFEEPTNFSKFFRSQAHKSPAAFRAEHLV